MAVRVLACTHSDVRREVATGRTATERSQRGGCSEGEVTGLSQHAC